MANRPSERIDFRFCLKAGAVAICLAGYLFLGLTTELELIGRKPLPGHLIEDFDYYREAYLRAKENGDPYAVRDIGYAFLYPPPALLVVGAFAPISSLMPRTAAVMVTNLVLLSLMIYGVARLYGYSLSDVWWWFPLGLGFGPFLEVLLLGQINTISQFGVFLTFLLQESAPMLSGVALALGVVTKVTPIAFVGYLLANRNLRAIAGVCAGLAVLILLTVLAYGWRPFPTFVDVFRDLLGAFPLGPNSHSFAALLESHTPLTLEDLPGAQRALTIYIAVILAISGLITYLLREREPSFIVFSFGLTLLPNVMWYHHYIFFLLPVFVWMAWSRLHPAIVVWCFAGLTLIQVDRLYSFLEVTHGALAHAFGHLSMLVLLGWQVRRAIDLVRSRPDLRKLLRWGV